MTACNFPSVPLRVGFFTYGMDDNLTGIGNYARSLSYALQRVNPSLQLTLISPHVSSSLQWYRDFPTYRVPLINRLPAVMSIGAACLGWAASDLNLDVLHDPCGIAPFFPRRRGLAHVVTVHDAIPHRMPSSYPFLTKAVFKTLVPACRWTADAVLTDSHCSKRDLVRFAHLDASRVHIASPGMRLPSASSLVAVRGQVSETLDRLDIREPYVLYVGGMNPRKNLVRLVAAFKIVSQVHPLLQLVLVGPRTWQSGSSVTAAEGLAERVRITGFVSDSDRDALYAGAACLVFPSLYEGFGLPILEAMALGTPVITSNSSAMAEVAGDAALLVNPENADEIAAAIRSIVEDDTLAASLTRAGRKQAGRFSWDATAVSVLKIYGALANFVRSS